MQKLLDYQRYQDSGKQLYKRPLLARDVWARGFKEGFFGGDDGSGEIILDEGGLFSLVASYRRALRKALSSVHQVHAKGQSIIGRIGEIRDRLIVGLRINMRDLLPDSGDGPIGRKHLLMTFLSLLELGRMGFVSLFQSEAFADIYVEALRPIGSDALERVQEFDSEGSEELAARLFSADAARDEEPALVRSASDDEIFVAEHEMPEASA